MTVCKMSVEEKLRKLRGKRTLKILINSQRGKFSAEFYGKWGIRVECTACLQILINVFLFTGLILMDVFLFAGLILITGRTSCPSLPSTMC